MSFAAPHVSQAPKPNCADEARSSRIEGTVRLEALFGSAGQIEQAIVTQELGFGLDDAAARAARRVEFTPGRLDDKPAPVWAGVVYRFSILEAESLIPATPVSKSRQSQ